MLMTKVAALVLGIGMFIVALSIVTYDLVTAYRYREALRSGAAGQEPRVKRWRMTVALLAMSWAPLLIAASMLHSA